jgi:hypothetical protein
MKRLSWAWVLASGLVVACSGGDVDLDSGGQEGSGEAGDDGNGDTGGTGGDDGYPGDTGGTDGGTEPEQFSCESVHRTPTEPGVLFDVDVACSHTMFARYGVAAAASAASDAVYLATAGFEESWVFRIDANAVDPVAEAPLLTQQRVLMMLDSEEYPTVAGMVDDDTVAIARFTDRWERQNIEVDGGADRIVDLVAGADGSASLWLHGLSDIWSVARRTDDAWTIASASLPAGAAAPRFTIATDGSEIAAAHLPATEADTWRLAARVGSEDTLLLGDVSDALPSACVAVHDSASEELSSQMAPFAVVSARSDALVLDDPRSVDASLAIPDTGARVSSCPDAAEATECLPQCHDVSAGRLDDAFAAARTDDGTVWIGWVHADVDRVLTYVETCDENGGSCWCDEEIIDDLSTYTLRVVGVRDDGTVESALTVPLADDPCGDQFIAPGDGLDLHAHGSRLAIAVRTAKSDVLPGPELFTLRTLLVDTTAFASPQGGG